MTATQILAMTEFSPSHCGSFCLFIPLPLRRNTKGVGCHTEVSQETEASLFLSYWAFGEISLFYCVFWDTSLTSFAQYDKHCRHCERATRAWQSIISPSLADLQTSYPPSRAEGARGWVNLVAFVKRGFRLDLDLFEFGLDFWREKILGVGLFGFIFM